MPSPVDSDEASDVALLIGVPATRNEFEARVPSSDWLSKFAYPTHDVAERQRYLDSVWAREYDPLVAQPIHDLIELAGRLGVGVRTAATLETIRETTKASHIVILFAHWKGPEILNGDLLCNEALRFHERLDSRGSPLERWFLSCFKRLLLQRESASSWKSKFLGAVGLRPRLVNGVRAVLREAMREVLDDQAMLSDGEVDQVLQHEVTTAASRREEMDILFDGLLLPGNRLELFDGLHSKESVEVAIDPEFRGIIDLTTCTSTVLADFISARRAAEIRTVQFPTVQDFLWASICVRATLELMTTVGVPYCEARLLAAQQLKGLVRGMNGKVS